MPNFFADILIYLTAAVIAVPLASRLGLGSVLGYLAAGITIGPILGLVGAETQEIQHFAEFGVVMMLFVIGLELAPQTLWDMRRKILGLGGLQLVLSIGAISWLMVQAGYVWQTGLAVGMIFALSSTAIVLQTMTEKGLMRTNGGRSSFAVLLTQDIAVIPMLALMPLLAIQQVQANPDGSISRGQSFIEAQSHSASGDGLLHGLPAWASALTIIVIFAVIIMVGIFMTRPIFRFIHYARLREMYTALALLIVVGIALLMKMIGLSPALGTFLAGVVLANSEFRHELHSDIEPFKGLLLGLFFITVGAGINFSLLFGNPFLIIGQTIGLILVKAAVLFALSLVFRIKGRSRWLFTLSLAQAGEFGFVLVTYALNSNVIPVLLAERLLLIVALSMLVTPLLFLAYEAMAKRMSDVIPGMEGADEIDEQGPVIIAGVGRFGQIVNRLVRNSGIKTIVLDDNLKTIQLMRRFGFKGFFGDPARPELLKAAGIGKARVLVVALDNPEKSTQLVERIRREYKDLHIVARAFDRNHVFELHNAGANDIVRETFDSSLRAGRYVLENAGLTEFEAAEAESTFYQHDRKAMRALTKVWRKSVSPEDNPAYISLSRALEQELEAALLAQLAETKAHPAQPSETPASAKVAMPE